MLVCIDSKNYEASIRTGATYRNIDDELAQSLGFVRVFDDSGDSHLFPARCFEKLSPLVSEMVDGMDKFCRQIEDNTAVAKCGRCGVTSSLGDPSCRTCGVSFGY